MNAVASKFLAATLALLLCMAAGLPARAQAPEVRKAGSRSKHRLLPSPRKILPRNRRSNRLPRRA